MIRSRCLDMYIKKGLKQCAKCVHTMPVADLHGLCLKCLGPIQSSENYHSFRIKRDKALKLENVLFLLPAKHPAVFIRLLSLNQNRAHPQ